MSEEVDFPDEERKALEQQSLHGENAARVRGGDDWKWLKEFLFTAMEEQAVNTLCNAKSEEERMKAQQMFLAVRKPQDLLDFLVTQGDAARASLIEISTRDNAEGSGQ